MRVVRYYIDELELTWNVVKQCVRSGRCHLEVTPKDNAEAVIARYDEAVEICSWLHGRLPTNEEWEVAARGADERLFPWGNGWDPAKIPRMDIVRIRGGDGTDFTGDAAYIPHRIDHAESPFGVWAMVGALPEYVQSSPESPITRGASEVSLGDTSDPTLFYAARIHRDAKWGGVRCVYPAENPAENGSRAAQ